MCGRGEASAAGGRDAGGGVYPLYATPFSLDHIVAQKPVEIGFRWPFQRIAGSHPRSYKGAHEVSMHSRSIVRSAALAFALLGAPALAWAQKGNERPPPPPDNVVPQRILKVFPFDTTWMAVNLNGKAFAADRRPAFILDKQFRGRGFGGCNTFSATTYAMQDRVAVGPIALTKETCDKATAEAERAFLVVLRTSQVWELKDGKLLLKGPNGIITFERSM